MGNNIVQMDIGKFFSLSMDLLCVAHSDGYLKAVNPAFTSVLGYSEEELLGKPLIDFIHPDDRASTMNEVKKQLDGKPTIYFENRYLCKNGSYKWLAWNAVADIQTGHLYAIARDITQSKKMDATLRSIAFDVLPETGEDFLLQMTKSLANALGTRYVFISETPREDSSMIGTACLISDGELAENFSYDLKGTPCEKVYELGIAVYPSGVAAMFPEDPWLEEHNIESYMGVALYGQDGAAIGHIGALDDKPLDDLTYKEAIFKLFATRVSAELRRQRLEAELRESEERFRGLVENIDDVFWIMSPDPREILYVSPAYEKVCGRSRKHLLESPHLWMEYVHPDDKEEALFSLNDWITGKSSAYDTEYRILAKNGETRYIHDRGVFLKDDGSGKTLVAGVARDITERVKTTEAQMRLSKARDYFTSVTAHELRTPLTNLQLLKKLMENISGEAADTETVSQARRVLDNAYQEFDKIISTTDIITDLSLEKLTQRLKPVPLAPLLRYTVNISKHRITEAKRDISINVDISPLESGVTALCDEFYTQKAFLEILSNAIKYTEDGKHLWVSGKVEDNFAHVVFRDEGMGISEYDLETVTHPYYSPANEKTHFSSKYDHLGGGIGLGLTLVKSILESCGGAMKITSPGKNMGTEVTLSLPVHYT